MIVVVSGIHRSGTSMMMGALNDGGIPILWDESREYQMRHRDTEEYMPNKYGFWEIGQKVYMVFGYTATIPDNHAVKIQYTGLPILAARDEGYKIIMMRRDPAEIRASMIEWEIKNPDSVEGTFDKDHPNWSHEYHETIRHNKDILTMRRDCEFIEVWFKDVVENPLREMERVRDFGILIDPEKAIKMIDPTQYRHRHVQSTV